MAEGAGRGGRGAPRRRGAAGQPSPRSVQPVEMPITARGRRTRAALLRSAREVFEQQGFDDARVTDIADSAGVGHGTFYTYFDSKESIFKEVVSTLVGEMFAASRVGANAGADPIERIEAANRQYLQAYARNARMLLILEQVATFNPYFAKLTREIRGVFVDRAARGIRRLQEAGAADPTLDPTVTASALGGMVEHFARLWLALGEPVDEQVAVDTLTRLWAQGVGLSVPYDRWNSGDTRRRRPARTSAASDR